MFQLQSKSDAQLQQIVEKQIGPGPMRFGPITHEVFSSFRALSARLTLSQEDKRALTLIQSKWDTMSKKESIRKKLTKVQILRIAHFCKFDVDRSLKLMRNIKSRHLGLCASKLKDQLATQTLVPCPGLESHDGSKVFVMRPSRYHPQDTPVSDIIDHLIFVMDHMVQQDILGQQKGVAFVANMSGWTIRNFSYDYCRKFMMTLQGHIFPVKVNLFLIVNPPSWFGKVWAMMKPMLSLSFRKNVHMIDIHDLHCYLKGEYAQHLPDDIPGGTIPTDQLVRDYISFHLALETATTPSRGVGSLIPRSSALRANVT